MMMASFPEKVLASTPVLVTALLFLLVSGSHNGMQLAAAAVCDCEPGCPLIAPLSAFPPPISKESDSSPVTPSIYAALESTIQSFITQQAGSQDAVSQYAVSIVHEDRLVFTSGLSTIPFAIGSLTKVFTALGALILREKGELSLDDPVKKFLPTFSVINPYDNVRSKPHDITLRELMGHVSGLPRELCVALTCPGDESEVLEAVAKMQLVRPPWSREPAYSNLGFALLGHAWEKVTPNKSWSQFVMEEIVEPLGMSDTGVDLTNITLASYDGPLPNASAGWTAPAGSMYSTATDLAKFLVFLLKASPPLISDASIGEWTHSATISPDRQSAFALPWELLSVNFSSEFLITKEGDIFNFDSIIAIHPPTQLGVSVLLAENVSSAVGLSPSLATSILDILVPAVEAFNDEIIGANYNGLYICELTPPLIVLGSPNRTLQVVGGHITVTSSPSLGLAVFLNVTITDGNGQVDPVIAPFAHFQSPLLLKNATENSFWFGPKDDCFDFFTETSAFPSFTNPNYPGSIYGLEIVFDLSKHTLKWPYVGGVCVKRQ